MAAVSLSVSTVKPLGDRVFVKVSESEEKAIDPVCGMQVDTELNKNTVQFKNQDYHFCCNGCKTKFKNNPELFLVPSST